MGRTIDQSYELFHKETGEVVGRGSKMIGTDQKEYIFKGFSRGRIGPKLLVHDINMNLNREFFPSVFPDFEIREVPSGN